MKNLTRKQVFILADIIAEIQSEHIENYSGNCCVSYRFIEKFVEKYSNVDMGKFAKYINNGSRPKSVAKMKRAKKKRNNKRKHK